MTVERVRVSRAEARPGFPQGVLFGLDDRARTVWLLEPADVCRDVARRLYEQGTAEVWRRDSELRRLV